ncbi:PQQ-binding-like beta-propeller repeat protein [Streptomyces sp. p1417]|uniref:PQQ-binding-like beta-propeller repeat protein n=1 Tax=Streptomyces typhae TaxID=2681492 RepID=A0A6L6WZF6_9ACTN|nr:serine/threonine-protein kinase [Streptomyces typhae]MVO86884.1 PQQ-binding-like beta-propeller repeat protein [Streptomyces typhae]
MTSPLLADDPCALGGHRLLARLGAGGMGQVYLARSPGGRLLALKTVHAHLAADARFRERFRREATAARAVTGAHTAAVVDADPDAEQPWLATAYLPGVTLRQAVGGTGPLTPETVRALAAALAEALSRIHAAGIVHRDLKPSNVLLTADGPRVIDFGVARATEASGHGHQHGALTATGALLGTPGYMAPEQVLGGTVGPATDVFALGAVLVFAATGTGPFGTGPLAVLLYRAAHEEPDLASVPRAAGLRDLAAGCLHRDPALRPGVEAVLRRTAAPDSPLWWRREPLRTLIADAAPGLPPADVPAPDVPEPDATPTRDTSDAAGATPRTSVTPAPPRSAARRRTLTRRAALAASGGAAAALAGWAIGTAPGSTDGSTDEYSFDWWPGDEEAGATRWMLKPGKDPGGDGVNGLLLAGDTGSAVNVYRAGDGSAGHAEGTVLVHAPARGTSLGGAVTAVRATDGSQRWRRDGGTAEGPTLWGVHDGLLIAPEVLPEVIGVATGKPWPVLGAWPSVAARWYAVVGRRLVTLHTSGSADDPELRLRTLPDGSAPDLRTDVPVWLPPAVHGSSLLLAPEPASPADGATCLDARTGKQRWSYEGLRSADRAVAAPVTLPRDGARGARFALLTEEAELHLIDVRDGGRAVARRRLGMTAGRGTTALGYAAGVGLALGGGRLVGFAPGDGEELWSHPSAGLDASWPRRPGGAPGPVTADGVLVHWADTTTLQGVDLRDGREPLWRAPVDATDRRPPVVGGGTVYVTAGQEVHALSLRDGKHRTSWSLPEADSPITSLAADSAGWYAIAGGSVQAVNAPAW